MEDHEIKPIIEALLFVSGDSISIDRLKEVLGGVEKDQIRGYLEALQAEYLHTNRGIQIVEVGGEFQITTRAEMAPWIREFEKIKTAARLSPASLETLAIIAYKQPLTRAEIEAIRGVDGAGVLKTLLERRMVKIMGRKEVAGRPLMYGTTREFLKYFGLANLAALPTLKEFSHLSEQDIERGRLRNGELDLTGVLTPGEEIVALDSQEGASTQDVDPLADPQNRSFTDDNSEALSDLFEPDDSMNLISCTPLTTTEEYVAGHL
jgi:segregation and condensation protein B